MKSGIYTITSPSGKQYVGSAVNFSLRWANHLKELRKGKHHSRILQCAWDKHGESAFVFKELLICAKHDLLMYEQRAIDALKPEYNVCKIAGSRLGVIHTDEARLRMSASKTGRKDSPETIAKKSAAQKGKTIPLEQRLKMSVAAKTLEKSEEHRINIGLAGQGRKASDEARAKLSAARMGHPVSEETRRKISEARQGKIASAETRLKIGLSGKGRIPWNKGKSSKPHENVNTHAEEQ